MTLQKKLLIYSGRPANCSNKINIPKINFFFSMRMQNKHENTQMLLIELNEKQIITEID